MPETIRKFPRYIDGYYGTPVRISRTPREYPFRLNGDVTTAVYTATYLVDQGKFTPTAAGTVDPENAGFYLLAETIPEIVDGDLATFRRTYSNIPATQTVVTSVALAKPTVEGTPPVIFGGFRIIQPDTSLLRYDVYAAQDVLGDTGAPGFYPTGGTYTLTFAGDTTGAIAYNASAATVQTALNALTSVSNRGSVVVTGSYNSAGGFTIAFNDYAQITIATGSLTGGTAIAAQAKSQGGYLQTVGAALQPVKETISIDTSLLVKSAGTWVVQTDYSDSGAPLLSDLSRVSITPSGGYYFITGGTWTLTIGAYTTAAIPYNAGLAEIQEAIDLVAAGRYRIAAWDTFPAGLGYYNSGLNSLIIFAVYFAGGPATGGTFTLTVGADTTSSLAYNASASTVQTALNALTTVTNRGGCTVSGDLTTGYAITFSNAAMTAASGSLTPTGSLATPAITDTLGRTQSLNLSATSVTRDLAVTAHGITTADVLYVKLTGAETYAAGISDFTVPNANTIRLNLRPSQTYANWSTIVEVGKRTKAAYTPGAATVRAERITEFFLPGVTSGITTAADIPIPVSQSEPISIMLGIFAGTGTINWQVGELTQWRESAILSLTRTTVRASDL